MLVSQKAAAARMTMMTVATVEPIVVNKRETATMAPVLKEAMRVTTL